MIYKRKSVLTKSLFRLALAGVGLLILNGCSGKDIDKHSSRSPEVEPIVNPPAQRMNQSEQRVNPPEQGVNRSEPSINSFNPLGNCPYNIKKVRSSLEEKTNKVIDNWPGNVWLNTDLTEVLTVAEKIKEDPRCADEVKTQQLAKVMDYSKKVLTIGDSRVSETMDAAAEAARESARIARESAR